MTSVFCGFRSAPFFVDGTIKVLQTGRHQDRVAEDVAVVDVPLVCQASIFLWSMWWVVSSREFCSPAQRCVRSAGRQRAFVFRLLPIPVLNCTPRGHRHLLVPRRGPWALAGVPLARHDGSGGHVGIVGASVLRPKAVANGGM